MTRKELSEATAEAAALTKRAAARTEWARAGIEAAIARQEAAIARQESATANFKEAETRRDADWAWLRESSERQEKLLQSQIHGTDEIIAELRDQRDERRALIEALLRLTDRLPPPPPHLKSA
ncbi:MAG TPA: hypothetical protein VFN85_02195 [Solirubrobacterales bacterium]|nr:hypothetical protein [Solirubrobacterales bacterium]